MQIQTQKIDPKHVTVENVEEYTVEAAYLVGWGRGRHQFLGTVARVRFPNGTPTVQWLAWNADGGMWHSFGATRKEAVAALLDDTAVFTTEEVRNSDGHSRAEIAAAICSAYRRLRRDGFAIERARRIARAMRRDMETARFDLDNPHVNWEA